MFKIFYAYAIKIRISNIPESDTPKSKTSSGNVFTDIDIVQ